MRVLSRALVRKAIVEQKEYLLCQMNPQYHAYYKLYDAKNDRPETRMRTTYTASTLWTLLQMHEFKRDPRIAARITPIADYLRSMQVQVQVQVQAGKGKGAFHYSFDTTTKVKELRFVLGSTAKTVFTLLERYRRTGEKRYLTAAQNAGKWLSSRVKRDGRVYPVRKLAPHSQPAARPGRVNSRFQRRNSTHRRGLPWRQQLGRRTKLAGCVAFTAAA